MTAISPSRDRKRKCFQFTLQDKQEENWVVSFSPKRHKLLLKTQVKQKRGEIKKFLLNDKNETVIGDYFSVCETQPMFERKEKEHSFVSVVNINNVAELYVFVNVTRSVCNISLIDRVETNEKDISMLYLCNIISSKIFV